MWSCVLLQLWVRPASAHLLPAPIAYYIIKQVFNFTGITRFIINKLRHVRNIVWAWMEERFDMFFPPPLLFILNISYNVERKLIDGTKHYIDAIVTGLMIICMVLGLVVATIFISFQVFLINWHLIGPLTNC